MKQAQRRTQAERTETSDNRMVDAAIELIIENGPSGTTLTEVGLRAGYSRGLAGQRFGSKDKLFAFVLRRIGDEWLTHLKEATNELSGADAMRHALDEHYRFCVDAPDRVRAFYTLWFESVNAGSELAEIIKHIHSRRHQDVIGWIESDNEIAPYVKSAASAIAGQFCASIIGIVYYWLANPDDLATTRKLHENLKRFMTKFLEGPNGAQET